MKKQLLSILTAGCLMAAMVPAAFAADANDLQAQIDAAEAGSTIKLNENTTITSAMGSRYIMFQAQHTAISLSKR